MGSNPTLSATNPWKHYVFGGFLYLSVMPGFKTCGFVMPNDARILMPASLQHFQPYKKYAGKMYGVMPV